MSMSDTKAADLAAIRARWELNYSVARHPMFAGIPLVAAALANAKACDAAFLAALAEVEAERNLFRMWSTHRHFRQACAASDKAHATLREVIGIAEDEYKRIDGTHIALADQHTEDTTTNNRLRGGTSAKTIAESGRAYLEKGQLDRAISDFDEAIRLDPRDAVSFAARGVAYGMIGQHNRAITDYDEAIRLNPKNANAFYNRGNSYKKTGEHDRAIIDYSEAVRLDPDFAHAFMDRGRVHNAKGQYDRAITDYDQAIRLDPKFASFFFLRSLTYAKKGHIDRAICDLDEAIRLDPKDAEFSAARGQAHFDKGDYDRAILDFDQAIRLDQKNADFLQRRGSAYLMKGQSNRAIIDYDQAIKLNPKDADCFASRGRAYENKGDSARAIADLAEAIRLNPNYTWAINNRAKIVAREKLWGFFRGKANTKAVLREKAAVVTHLIIERCDAGIALVTGLRDKFPDTRFGEDELRQAQSEIAALLIYLVDRSASGLLGAKDEAFEIFMDALANDVAGALRKKGVDSDSFWELLSKRYEEYRHYQIRSWEENENKKGELFWEFGKTVSTALCGFEHPVFGISLATLMLEALVELTAGMSELLPESPR
jgi:tetratricopeptide (TPR) repeat protein